MNDKDLDQIRKAVRAEMATYFFDLTRKKRNIRMWVKEAWKPHTEALTAFGHESWPDSTTPQYLRLEAAAMNAKARMVELFGYEEDESILDDEDRLTELAARLLYLDAVK